jgi:hypothetical protein
MRRSIPLLVLAAFAAAVRGEVSAAQSPRGRAESREQRAVLRARAVYALTNRETPTLRPVERRILGMSTEGAELKAYYRGSELRRIDVTWGGETLFSEEQYFFDGDGPVFMYRKEHSRRGTFGPVVRITESRFYYVDGELVRWLDGSGRAKRSGTTEWIDHERETQHDIAAMLCALAGTDREYEVDAESPPQPGRACPTPAPDEPAVKH